MKEVMHSRGSFGPVPSRARGTAQSSYADMSILQAFYGSTDLYVFGIRLLRTSATLGLVLDSCTKL